jgi:hypothetical protein
VCRDNDEEGCGMWVPAKELMVGFAAFAALGFVHYTLAKAANDQK